MAVVNPSKPKWANVATVTLLVGEAETVFHVHEAVLFEVSSFFKAAFTSEFHESSARTMTLPEDDESTFEIFVNWLYHRRCDLPERSEVVDVFMRLVQIFVLADKYDVPNLKNLVLRKIFHLIRSSLTGSSPTPGSLTTTINYAYEHTSQNSGLRKLLADNLVWNCTHSWYREADHQAWLRDHPDISMDVNVRFAKFWDLQENPFYDEMPEEYLDEEQE